MRHRRPAQSPGHWTAAVSVLLAVLSAGVFVAALQTRVWPDEQPRRVTPEATQPGRTRPKGIEQARPVSEARPAARGPSSSAGRAHDRPRDVRDWRAVLAGLDRRRARAYAQADAGLLHGLYAPGSRVLRQDEAMLLRYRRRGLRVTGMRMRILDMHVRARRRDRVVLVVRERLSHGTLSPARPGDSTRGGPARRLPADDVDEHLLTLRRVAEGGWRIASVRPVRS